MAISFQKAEALFNERRGVSKHLRPELGSSKGSKCRLHKIGDHYAVSLYDTNVVEIHPERYVLNTGGWETALTAEVIWRVSGARVHAQTVKHRESSYRVNGYPYFPGIRVDTYGNVLPEDKRPDIFERPSKEGVKEYAALSRWLKRTLKTRWELGEFKELDDAGHLDIQHLAELDEVRKAGGDFPPHELALRLASAASGDINNISIVLDGFRTRYHLANDNYVTTEE